MCNALPCVDHSLAVNDLKEMGIPLYLPYQAVKPEKVFDATPFRVQAFDLPHGDCACYGFLIKVAGKKILYLTDFELCKYNFRRLMPDVIVIEANYQNKYVDEDAANYNHKILDHAELGTTIDFIRENATSHLSFVILCHMGVSSIDAHEAVREVRKIVTSDTTVDYAVAGNTYFLSKE